MSFVHDYWKFKEIVLGRQLCVQEMSEDAELFVIKAFDPPRSWACEFIKPGGYSKFGIDSERQTAEAAALADYETTFRGKCDHAITPRVSGCPVYRSESRPIEFTSWFSISGDDVENRIIGGGTVANWDFTNSLDDQTKELEFIDPICIKDRFVAWTGGSAGSFLTVEIVCPAGGYYLANEGANAGTYVQAQADTVINRYINRVPCMGDAPMGVDFEVETASETIPAGYKIKITAESDVNTFKGFIRGEFYRERSVILE